MYLRYDDFSVRTPRSLFPFDLARKGMEEGKGKWLICVLSTFDIRYRSVETVIACFIEINGGLWRMITVWVIYCLLFGIFLLAFDSCTRVSLALISCSHLFFFLILSSQLSSSSSSSFRLFPLLSSSSSPFLALNTQILSSFKAYVHIHIHITVQLCTRLSHDALINIILSLPFPVSS